MIRLLNSPVEAAVCARLMSTSEPWITLRRGFKKSLEVLTDSTREVYIVEKNNEIAGFAILNMNGPFIGYIQSICIEPDYRNQGIGKELLACMEALVTIAGAAGYFGSLTPIHTDKYLDNGLKNH